MKTIRIFLLLFIFSILKVKAAVFTVNSTTGTGVGTFVWAVTQANGSAGPHTIDFTGLTGLGPWTYTPGSPIPDLTSNNVTIDGTTAPGYNCATGPLFIVIGPGFNDFQINGAGCIIRAISFRAHQVELNAASIQMYGCWFNLNDAGTAGAGGDPNGPFLITNSCDNCIIGGSACGQSNVISGSGNAGSAGGLINIVNGNTMSISYTYIGTSASGNTLLNTTDAECVRIDNTTPSLTFDNCVFAGAKGGTPNGYGLNFTGTHNNLTVSNCKIGTPLSGNVLGNATFGNDKSGIYFNGCAASNITITSNIVCNNGRNVVNGSQVDDAGIAINANATKVGGTIQNNYIGVDASYNLGGNKFYGIYMFSNANLLNITGNKIGDNGNNTDVTKYGGGIAAVGSITNINILGNHIGVSPTGADIGNYNNGIHIESVTISPCNIVIGTSAGADKNYIGFNKGMRTSENGGIYIFQGTGISIQNNNIGLSPIGGNAGQKNGGGNARGGNGIMCNGSGALNVRIGGTAASTQNYICYNITNGVNIYNSADFIEMNYNSMYCNTNKAINLNCGASPGNNSFGCVTLTAAGVGGQPYVSVTGNKPTNSLVDVFGTGICALGAGSCIPQQEYRYGGIAANAATTYTYNNGSAMYNDLSVDATGTGTDCNSGYCRTSELVCIDNILPVKFLSFSVKESNSTALLEWSTSVELNNKEFLIQRSDNGIDFETIGTIKGANTSNTVQSYSFADLQPFFGKSYYRLEQIDLDTKSSFSASLLYTQTSTPQLSIYPIPTNGEFDLLASGMEDQIYEFSILDIFGRTVFQETISTTSTQFNTHIVLHEAPGLYFIKLKGNTTTLNSKVILK